MIHLIALLCILIIIVNNFLTFIYLTEITVSVMTVVSNIAAEEERFTIATFPPRISENRNNNIYNSILPESVIVALTTSMLVIIAWIIYKVN